MLAVGLSESGRVRLSAWALGKAPLQPVKVSMGLHRPARACMGLHVPAWRQMYLGTLPMYV